MSVDVGWHYVRLSYLQAIVSRCFVDPWIQIFGVVGQLFFYGGLLMLLCGLPFFIWLAVRACRDLHRIADALELERAKFTVTEVDHAGGSVTITPSGRAVANSAFGR